MSNLNSLFRAEAVDYRQNRQRKEVLLQGSKTLQPLLWILCACFLALLLVVNQIEYTEVLTARGRLISGQGEVQLVAPKPGLIHAIYVEAGDQVSAGEIVAQITQQLYDPNGDAITEQERSRLTLEIDSLRRETLLNKLAYEQRAASLRASRVAQQEEIHLATQSLSLLNEQESISAALLAGISKLLDQGSVSAAQASQQQLAHLDLSRERHQAQSQLNKLKSLVHETETAMSVLQLEEQQTLESLSRRINLLGQQRDRLDDQTMYSVVANRPGVVTATPVESGNPIQQGQPVVYLQPQDEPLLAEVYVPSSIMGKLAPGQEVLLHYDAFDVNAYGRYEGTIEQIERTALDQRQHLLPVTGSSEPLFRIVVKPAQHFVEGEDIFPLQAGLLLNADFVANELSLLEYIFKPVLKLRGKVT